jgi:hypothetical protein
MLTTLGVTSRRALCRLFLRILSDRPPTESPRSRGPGLFLGRRNLADQIEGKKRAAWTPVVIPGGKA